MGSVLFIDIPTYQVQLEKTYSDLLLKRLKLQRIIMSNRTGLDLKRGQVNYSRGLLSIATMVRSKGIETRYLIYSDQDDQKMMESAITEVDYIAVSAITPTIDLALKILDNAKRIRPQVITIVGGPHAQIKASDIIKMPAVDIVSCGDGLDTIPSVLEGKQLDNIPNLLFKTTEGKIINTISAQIVSSRLLSDRMVDYSLLSKDISFYSHNLRTQNGCPFRCAFCYESAYHSGNQYTQVPIKVIVEEISHLNQTLLPGTLVHFSDPVFTLDKKRTIALCAELQKLDLKLFFSIDTRVDCIDADIIKELTKARIIYYRFGLEDASREVIDRTQKGIDLSSFVSASKLIRMIAPQSIIMAYWITGLPGTTYHSVVENGEIIKLLIGEKVLDIIGNKVLVPYPGTKYAINPFKYMMEIKEKNWSAYDRLSKPVYDLDTMNSEEIFASFIFLEKQLIEAYEDVLLGTHISYLDIPEDDLDYVHLSYVNSE